MSKLTCVALSKILEKVYADSEPYKAFNRHQEANMSKSDKTSKREQEDVAARTAFVEWVNFGSLHLVYSLHEMPSGEYVSIFTEYAFMSFRAGWRERSGVWA